ncbi:MAG: rod shape-determining protein MreC [Patescibacteria group bacterium]
MNYQSRSRPWRGYLLLSLIITIFIIVWLREPIAYGTTSLFSRIAVPIWRVTNSITHNVEVTRSQSERSMLKRISVLENENYVLRILLEHSAGKNRHLAYVLSSIRSSPYDTIIIDQGSDQGIEPGRVVISDQGVALGKIIEVYPKISKIELFSAYGKDLELILDGEERVIASGQGSQNFYLRLPRGINVTASSTLMLPGAENLLIANVENIKNDSGDAFQKVLARLPVNIHAINKVYVLE